MPSLSLLLVSLGKVIRSRRAAAGYSQERFASAIRRHRTFMGLLERGKANPTIETLHLVAQGLGMSVPELVALAGAEAADPSDPLRPAPTAAARAEANPVSGRRRRKERKPRK